jgi:hypothetical protein
MKALINDPEQEKLDLLIFEYLEEELPEEEAEALESRLAKDPVLQEELESWEGAYVKQDFYNTALLEERLLSPTLRPESFSFSISLNAIVLAVMTTLLSFVLITDESRKDVSILPALQEPVSLDKIGEDVKEEPERVLTMQGQGGETGKAVAKERHDVATIGEEPKMKNTYTLQPEEKYISLEELPKIESQAFALEAGSLEKVEASVKINKVNMATRKKVHSISRKQQRMIDKKIEKARQQRQAREFMKGNVPYVVPLHTQNF